MKDNQPFTDAMLLELSYDDLLVAALMSKTTPEQDLRIQARLKELAPPR